MTKQAKAFPILSVAVLLGCATPYQPAGFRGGYSDLTLDNNTVRVSFRGNGHTSSDTVEVYTLYRCAEIAAQKGFDYFVIVDKGGAPSQSFYNTPGTYSSSTTFTGNMAHTSGTYTPGATVPITRHRSTVVIKMFNGQKPDLPNAYMAKELIQNLRQQITSLPSP